MWHAGVGPRPTHRFANVNVHDGRREGVARGVNADGHSAVNSLEGVDHSGLVSGREEDLVNDVNHTVGGGDIHDGDISTVDGHAGVAGNNGQIIAVGCCHRAGASGNVGGGNGACDDVVQEDVLQRSNLFGCVVG